MAQLPLYIYLVFGLTVLVSVWLFYRATPHTRPFLAGLLIWIIIQSVLGLSGFYTAVDPAPPRFPFLLLPPVLTIVTLFNTTTGKRFVDSLDGKRLTLFHVIRIPVELVLFWLFTHRAIPELMTFEGRNFDILSGLTAPLVYYWGFAKGRVHKSLLLAWNFICLALVVNVAINGLLAAPTPFQQFAFGQPNIAIGYFPFNLLPACLVPLVVLAHLASIRQLLATKPIARTLMPVQS
ncbi:hypothetical protein [Spirosoma spitsbergense]|jgi:hypothetical protein|uniref:hypothetical protein n=1 Tax=Spirosoma spitsbergense TaxID=431554 RepID=UPI000366A64E|nr:hypothetical protein [Spirosoma spitsbergense]